MLTMSGMRPRRSFPLSMGSTLGEAKAQPANHLRAQLSTLHGVDRGVDSLMRNLQRRRIWMHKRQWAGNLLGRVALFQMAHHAFPQGRLRAQSALNP